VGWGVKFVIDFKLKLFFNKTSKKHVDIEKKTHRLANTMNIKILQTSMVTAMAMGDEMYAASQGPDAYGRAWAPQLSGNLFGRTGGDVPSPSVSTSVLDGDLLSGQRHDGVRGGGYALGRIIF
jgi:hypothetical protein